MKVWQVVSDPNSIVLMLSNYEKDSTKIDAFNGEKIEGWDAISFYTSIKREI